MSKSVQPGKGIPATKMFRVYGAYDTDEGGCRDFSGNLKFDGVTLVDDDWLKRAKVCVAFCDGTPVTALKATSLKAQLMLKVDAMGGVARYQELIAAAVNLYKRGHFAQSSCAGDDTNADLLRMGKALKDLGVV